MVILLPLKKIFFDVVLFMLLIVLFHFFCCSVVSDCVSCRSWAHYHLCTSKEDLGTLQQAGIVMKAINYAHFTFCGSSSNIHRVLISPLLLYADQLCGCV